MFWDDFIRRLRREARVTDARMLAAAGGHVATIPSRERRRRPALGWPLIVAIAVALAALLLVTADVHAIVAFFGI